MHLRKGAVFDIKYPATHSKGSVSLTVIQQAGGWLVLNTVGHFKSVYILS